MVGLRSLTLALRGLWWRRWSSIAIWIVAVACAAIAAAGPAFVINARDAVLQTTLRHAPVDARGTGVALHLDLDRTVGRTDLDTQASTSFTSLTKAGYLQNPVIGEQGQKGVYNANNLIVATLPMVYRQNSCAHVVMQSGSCVSESDRYGIMVTPDTAAARHWRVGTVALVGNKLKISKLHVRGIYVPVRPDDAYWFASTHNFFGQISAAGPIIVAHSDAAIVPIAFWTAVPPLEGDDASRTVDYALAVDRIHPTTASAFEPLLAAAVDDVETPVFGQEGQQVVVDTQVPFVLANARAATRAVSLPIFVVAAELLILTWLVLYLVLVSSCESRSGEIVLGKLRGLTARETVLHALLEPLLLTALAVPAGVAVCRLLVHRVGPSILGPGVILQVPTTSWLAAVGAGLGGVIAASLASVAVLRRSVVDQWRRTERRPRRGGWALDAVVFALAVFGFLELAHTPATEDTTQFLPAIAPGLLAVAAALLGVRLVPLIARAGFRPTRGSARVALFVALRQVGRRQGELRVFVLLTVAVALVVFGFASHTVFHSNQQQRALAEVGATRVLTVRARAGVDPSALVARADPAGRWASAVYDGPLDVDSPPGIYTAITTTTTPSTLVVDPQSFASVAFWRPDFGSKARLNDQLKPLTATPPAPVMITATTLQLTAKIRVVAAEPVQVHIGLTDSTGAPVDAVLGNVDPSPPRASPHLVELSARVPRCAAGCLLRRISLQQMPDDNMLLKAYLEVSALNADNRPVLPALLATTWTGADQNPQRVSAETVVAADGRLAITFAPAFVPVNFQSGYSVLSQVPAGVPALVTATQLTPATSDRLNAHVGEGLAVSLHPTRVSVLPRAGDAGAVFSRAWLPASRPDGYDQYRANEVWLSAAAPKDALARLGATGLSVLSVETADDRARVLGAQGPSFAVAMLALGAGAAGALAVAGASTSLFIASRRRLYEMAAMRSLGVRPNRLLGSLVLEHAAIGAAASLVGLAAGLVGAHVALARLPEFADLPEFPRLLIKLPILLCTLLVAAIVATVAAAAAAGGAALVRQASPTRLREAQT